MRLMSGMGSAIWITVMALPLLFAACDESEQGRILRYEKGAYLGTPDTQLTEDQVEVLRQRTTLQGGD